MSTYKKKEVYSSTELSDLLSSPVFYSVIILTFLLGLSSIFGFFQNPRKLKTVVDIISEKVSLTQFNTISINNEAYSMSQPTVDSDRYSIFSNDLFAPSYELNAQKNIQRVSFNYDITSKQFWGNLDLSRIESAAEKIRRENTDGAMVGTPITPEYHSEQGDAKYSMAAGLLRL